MAASPSASASRPRVEEVHLDAVEVVLGLGIHEAEYGVRVGGGPDVGNSPVVPRDGDVPGPLLPSRDVRISRGAGNAEQHGKEDELLHGAATSELESAQSGSEPWKLRRVHAGVEDG